MPPFEIVPVADLTNLVDLPEAGKAEDADPALDGFDALAFWESLITAAAEVLAPSETQLASSSNDAVDFNDFISMAQQPVTAESFDLETPEVLVIEPAETTQPLTQVPALDLPPEIIVEDSTFLPPEPVEII